MHSEVAWVLVPSGTQVHPQIILDPGYLPDYLSVSYDYAFIDLLAKDNSLTIHHRNLQKLVAEMFKAKVGIAPEIMKDFFPN